MNPWLNYSLILFAYLPGVAALLFWKKLWSFPILMMGFLGMFVFNAVGSISVLALSSVYWVNFDRVAVASEYSAVLVMQAVLYYLVAGTYIAKRSAPAITLKVTRFDDHFIVIGLLLIVGTALAYYLQTGTFLVLHSLDGTLTTENAYEYRMRYVYGLKNWPIYNLGFVMLPTFIVSYVFLRAKALKRLDFLFYFSIIICFSSSLSLGSKGGVLGFVLSLAVAYIVYLSYSKQPFWKILRSKKFFLFSLFAVVMLVVGYFRATPGRMTALDFLGRLWYRLFVTSTETIAAAISYSHEVGFLGVAVFPTARGLLPHGQANLPLLLHEYISLAPGGVNLPVAAEVFLVGGWLSLLMLLAVVFLVLVALQEFAFRLRLGIASLAFSAYYGYLCILLSVIGMFGTLFTFMYIGVLVLLTLAAMISSNFLKPKN